MRINFVPLIVTALIVAGADSALVPPATASNLRNALDAHSNVQSPAAPCADNRVRNEADERMENMISPLKKIFQPSQSKLKKLLAKVVEADNFWAEPIYVDELNQLVQEHKMGSRSLRNDLFASWEKSGLSFEDMQHELQHTKPMLSIKDLTILHDYFRHVYTKRNPILNASKGNKIHKYIILLVDAQRKSDTKNLATANLNDLLATLKFHRVTVSEAFKLLYYGKSASDVIQSQYLTVLEQYITLLYKPTTLLKTLASHFGEASVAEALEMVSRTRVDLQDFVTKLQSEQFATWDKLCNPGGGRYSKAIRDVVSGFDDLLNLKSALLENPRFLALWKYIKRARVSGDSLSLMETVTTGMDETIMYLSILADAAEHLSSRKLAIELQNEGIADLVNKYDDPVKFFRQLKLGTKPVEALQSKNFWIFQRYLEAKNVQDPHMTILEALVGCYREIPVAKALGTASKDMQKLIRLLRAKLFSWWFQTRHYSPSIVVRMYDLEKNGINEASYTILKGYTSYFNAKQKVEDNFIATLENGMGGKKKLARVLNSQSNGDRSSKALLKMLFEGLATSHANVIKDLQIGSTVENIVLSDDFWMLEEYVAALKRSRDVDTTPVALLIKFFDNSIVAEGLAQLGKMDIKKERVHQLQRDQFAMWLKDLSWVKAQFTTTRMNMRFRLLSIDFCNSLTEFLKSCENASKFDTIMMALTENLDMYLTFVAEAIKAEKGLLAKQLKKMLILYWMKQKKNFESVKELVTSVEEGLKNSILEKYRLELRKS
ncbi:hypothetical protein CCR75_002357 [Bremia lactucae]|uniref:Secreted RxLR effector n=1 Tax=Bremia lactucae TaxID=4779 RepID=A0A976FN17_BRELC|nr:hypothetical protein CCR75_002357 [Bremia lactucae]